ncbi:TetR family transcriptional regulator [Burkholderia ubonensis]|uniref:TetR family transcriptional regulator n=1 Tax=Burkholderia ubonensis TaxID=101571 RepID=UPI0009B426FC
MTKPLNADSSRRTIRRAFTQSQKHRDYGLTLITQNASGIAHHAGASVGALYHFFPSKENPLGSMTSAM